jgi:bleomycin hydrolase
MLAGVILFTIHHSLFTSCTRQEPKNFTHEVLNRMTPIKDQGNVSTCWIYAMLATIETEHLSWGDSVNLSPYYIEKMMRQEPNLPKDVRGMGKTALNLIQKYGIVGYNAMQNVETPAPRYVFMAGAEYTAQEFARSVCKPDEYIALTSNDEEPYYQEVDIDLPDNWMNDRFYNIPIDTLLKKTERAVRQHHGVCWEDENHAMAIVGIAHDDGGHKYFIMKNSWGTEGPYGGLDYISYKFFRKKTLAVEMTKEAYGLP